MDADLMRIPDVAEFLGVSLKTAYKLAEAKKIPARKVGNHWFISRAALKKFLGVPEEKAVQS